MRSARVAATAVGSVVCLLAGTTPESLARAAPGASPTPVARALEARTPAPARPAQGGRAPRAGAGSGWTTHHHDNTRGGEDPVAFSFAGAGGPLASWSQPGLDGKVQAEPLVYQGVVYVATENNSVYAFDEATGRQLWLTNVEAPASGLFGCGNIDPQGITGTPVIDPAAGILYAVGTHSDGRYDLYKLRLSDGALLNPPTGTDITPQTTNGVTFEPPYQGQRGALALSGGTVYVPFGGRFGDCGSYHPWVVGFPTAGGSDLVYQPQISGQNGAGIWAPSGEAVDASGNVYVETGNGFQSDCTQPWDHGDGVIKLGPGLAELGSFKPANWCSLNQADQDLGSVAPLVLPGNRLFAAGKSGDGWLLDTAALAALSPPGANGAHIGSCRTADAIFGGFAYWGAGAQLYVPCDGAGLVDLDLSGQPNFGSPRWTVCSCSPGPPIVAGGLVWFEPQGGGALYGVNESTGATQVNVSVPGGPRFATPAEDSGWIFVPTTTGVEALQFASPPALTGGWQPVGGVLTAAPAVSSWGGGRFDAFVRGSDGGLWHAWSQGGTAWTGFAPLGGVLTSAPAAAAWAPNRIDVFVRGADNGLWHAWWDGFRWNGYQALGGILTGAPAVAAWAEGRLDVIAAGQDGNLWHLWWDGARWNGWAPLGLAASGDPAVAAWGPNRLDVFVRQSDAALHHIFWDGTRWNGDQNLGGSLASGPGATSTAFGTLDVVALGAGGAVYGTAYAGGWSAWHSLDRGGAGVGDPAAASASPGTFELFVRGTDDQLWYAPAA